MTNKRVLAWVLLAGFVLLIVNVTFIGFYRTPSFIVYLVIAGYYLFAGNKKSNEGKSSEGKSIKGKISEDESIEEKSSEDEKNNMG